MVADCGVAQVFDFTIDGSKIWFTEWVENNIGVVDTTVPLPLDIDLESSSLILERGDSKHFNYLLTSKSDKGLMGVELLHSPTHDFIDIDLTHGSTYSFQLGNDEPNPIHTDISVSEDAMPGTYKVLIGLQTSDVAISKFVTVTIE